MRPLGVPGRSLEIPVDPWMFPGDTQCDPGGPLRVPWVSLEGPLRVSWKSLGIAKGPWKVQGRETVMWRHVSLKIIVSLQTGNRDFN